MSPVNVLCYRVKVSATGLSLVQRSSTECTYIYIYVCVCVCVCVCVSVGDLENLNNEAI